MICPKCGAISPDDLQFCQACGAALEKTGDCSNNICDSSLSAPKINMENSEQNSQADSSENTESEEHDDATVTDEHPGKKKKFIIGGIILGVIAVIAAVLLITGVCNGKDIIVGTWNGAALVTKEKTIPLGDNEPAATAVASPNHRFEVTLADTTYVYTWSKVDAPDDYTTFCYEVKEDGNTRYLFMVSSDTALNEYSDEKVAVGTLQSADGEMGIVFLKQ